jgi:hypothetical protein
MALSRTLAPRLRLVENEHDKWRGDVSLPEDEPREIDENDPGEDVSIPLTDSARSADGVTEHDDGSATVEISPGSTKEHDPEFFSNLAETLDDTILSEIGRDLWEFVEQDREARKPADEKYAADLERLGLGGKPKGGASFKGASKVVHPMVMEACLDFQAAVIREIFPLGGAEEGPAKMKIVGKTSKQKVAKAKRKSAYMNLQLTVKMRGFRPMLERLLAQVPMAGAGYLKPLWSKRTKKPKFTFVRRDEVFTPYDADSFEDAERITHRMKLTGMEYRRRVKEGMYRGVSPAPSMSVEESKTDQAAAKAEGKVNPGQNLDDTRVLYETLCWLEIDDDDRSAGEYAPYVVTFDAEDYSVESIYRYWDPDGYSLEPMIYLIEFPFFYWLGAAPIGITHLFGGLDASATGALRALLDSAHIQNAQAAWKLRGGAKGGQSIPAKPGEIHEIEGGMNADNDIRKTIMPVPHNGPSPVLMTLLGFLTEKGSGIVRSAMDGISDMNPNAPVGTTLALIEQGSKVFSQIHARCHNAMAQVLQALHQLNGMYLDEEDVVEEAGELMVYREDFRGPCDVVPVSDPNVFSDTQRMAQLQVIASRAQMFPMLYDAYKVEKAILKSTKHPEAGDFLIPKPEPKRLVAINEHVAVSLGQPIVAFPDQNHADHLRQHLSFLAAPAFGKNPLFQQVLPPLVQHIKEHIVYQYVTEIVRVGSEKAGMPVSALMDDDPDVSGAFDSLMADLNDGYLAFLGTPESQYAEMDQTLREALAAIQQMAPQMPMDPAIADGVKAKAAETTANTKAQEAQAKIQQAGVDAQREERLGQMKLANEQEKIAKQDNQVDRQIEADIGMNTADHVAAFTLAEMEIESGEKVALTNGKGIGEGGP